MIVVIVAIIVKLAINVDPVRNPKKQTALSFILSQSIVWSYMVFIVID